MTDFNTFWNNIQKEIAGWPQSARDAMIGLKHNLKILGRRNSEMEEQIRELEKENKKLSRRALRLKCKLNMLRFP